MCLEEEGRPDADGGLDPQACPAAEDLIPSIAPPCRVENLDPDLAAQLKEKLTQLESLGLLGVETLLEPREGDAGAEPSEDAT